MANVGDDKSFIVTKQRVMTEGQGLKLLSQGYTAQDLIGMGVPKSTAYNWQKRWRRLNPAPKEELSEGVRDSYLFKLFKRGKNLPSVVITAGEEYGITHDEVMDAWEKYVKATNMAAVKAETLEDLIASISSLDSEIMTLKNEIRALDGQKSAVKNSLTEVDAKAKRLAYVVLSRLEEVNENLFLLEKYPEEMLFRLLFRFLCCRCGTSSIFVPFACANCGADNTQHIFKQLHPLLRRLRKQAS